VFATIPPNFAHDTAAGLVANTVMHHIGRPSREDLLHAQQLLQDIPEVFKKAAGDPFACRALLLFLILDPNAGIRNQQLQQLKMTADRGVYPETLRLLHMDEVLQQAQRLPVVELALPTLRRLSKEQSRLFMKNLNSLIRTDGKLSLFEWCLYKIVVQHIKECSGRSSGRDQGTRDLENLAAECGVVISALVNATRHLELQGTEVFAAALKELGWAANKAKLSLQFSLKDLDRSLNALNQLNPQAKGKLIKACITCVVADGRIEPGEAELLRGIAASLSIPIPPLPAGQGKEPPGKTFFTKSPV